MRLWVDGQCLQTASRLRGIGRYVVNLLAALARRPDVAVHVSLNAGLPDEALAARETLSAFLPPENLHLWHGLCQTSENLGGVDALREASEIALRHHVMALAPDVALIASPFEGAGDVSSPLMAVPGLGVPTAAICYDFIPLVYAQAYLTTPGGRASYHRRLDALKGVDRLLAISDYTGQHAREVLPGVAVSEIGAGLSPEFAAMLDTPRDAAGVAPFSLLCVGSLDWRKNVEVVVRALAHLSAPLREQVQLRIAGAYIPPDAARLEALQRELGLPAQALRFLGMPDDAGLIAHYRAAALFVQPALLEGFGLTALEAMACGAPVIASNTGSLPEVVGEAEALFDPHDPQALARRIEVAFADPARLEAQGHAGQQRAASFTWDAVAARLVAALAPMTGGPAPTLAAARAKTLTALRAQALERSLSPQALARLMAQAEPPPPGPPRLLVEVTPALGAVPDAESFLAQAERLRGAAGDWPEVAPFVLAAPVTLSGPDGARLALRAGDHLLLPAGAAHAGAMMRGVLRAARLQGLGISVLVPAQPPEAPFAPVLLDLIRLARHALCTNAADVAPLRAALAAQGGDEGVLIDEIGSDEAGGDALERAARALWRRR